MNDLVLGASLLTNLVAICGLIFLLSKKTSEKKNIDVQYFEYIEDIEGAIRDSKKVTIKGQIFIDGIPVGGQYVVAERSFKKFDYEKLKEFKKEVVEPFAKASFQFAQALNGIPGSIGSAKNLSKVSKFFKSKSG